jgi:uncharacterized protein YpmS
MIWKLLFIIFLPIIILIAAEIVRSIFAGIKTTEENIQNIYKEQLKKKL